MLDGRKLVLVSTSDKTDLDLICPAVGRFYQLVSTGGTFDHLQRAGIPCIAVEEVTGLAEMLAGRVKTLHPAVLAGLLATNSSKDQDDLTAAGFTRFAGCIGSLYPFCETIARPDVTPAKAIESIDIGGVTFLRAAAKNFDAGVFALCDPTDYEWVAAELNSRDGALSLKTRATLATKVFRLTSGYDNAIAAYLEGIAKWVGEE